MILNLKNKKSPFLFFAVVLLILQFSCSKEKAEQSVMETENERPNIVLILADDMGYSDISSYGGEISTPNIDQLASEGIRFSQFYNAARCCPSRASLLTGLYPHQTGFGGMVNTNQKVEPGPYQGFLNKQCVTIAEVLREEGYYTAASGKWHVGEERPNWPTDRGFDNYYGLISGAANYFDITRGKREGIKRHFAMDSIEIMPPKEDFYMTNAITDNAVKFLETAAEKDKPFFLYLPYTAPHWPLHALQEDIELYKGKFMKGWDELRENRYQRMLEMGLVNEDWVSSDRNEDISSWESLTPEQQERMDLLMAIFAAQVHRMDQGIGQIMAQLEEMGATENTIVMFLSDNGGSSENDALGSDFWGNFWEGEAEPGSGDSYHSYGGSWANLSNTPFRYYKKFVHEGGIATPFIVSWPKSIANKGSITHEPGHIVDVMSTICEITGAQYPETYNGKRIEPMEGSSFASTLFGQPQGEERIIFWEHKGNKAVREGNWKLVAKDGEPWELYDFSIDRTETNNVIAENSEIAQRLSLEYKEWAMRVGVKEGDQEVPY